MTNIPYHLSESTFRKFETVIHLAIKTYPNVLVHTSAGSGFSTNTYAARLRDSLASYRKYRWPSALLFGCDEEALMNIKVAQRDNLIRTGSADKLKEVDVILPIEVKVQTNVPIFNLTTVQEQMLLCSLAAYRLLTQPVSVMGLTEQTVSQLMDNYDVTITKQTDSTYLIE